MNVPSVTGAEQPLDSSLNNSTQPITKPKAPTAPASALPVATAPAGIPVPPLSTSDPMAFVGDAPPAPTGPVTSSAGQTFVGGTQPMDPVTGAQAGNGVLGNSFVPYTDGRLVDLGGGMVAPRPGVDVSQGITFGLPPQIAPDRPYYVGGQAYNIGDTVPGQGVLSGYDPTTALPVFNNSGPVMTSRPPASLADLVNPNTPPASGGSGLASSPTNPSGNLVPASGPARLAPSGSPTTPTGSATVDPVSGATVAPPGNAPGTAPGSAPGNVGQGVSLTPTTIDNALTNSTISPNNTVDRVKLAQDALQSTIQNVLDPQFAANERDANRYAFGAGRGVSGTARTAQGNIVSDYNRQKTNLSNTLLNAAVNGSIDDLYRNIGIAQQQQGFQAGQQRTAFDEGLQQLLAGSSGDPSQIALVLAQIYGSGAGAAGNAASNYAASQQQQTSQQQQDALFQEFLRSLGQNGDTSVIDQILNQGIPGVQTTPGGGY